MTCSPNRRIEAMFCSWLMAPNPVWQSRCCTPTSRSSATCSRTRAGRAVKRARWAEHVGDSVRVVNLGIGPGIECLGTGREVGRIECLAHVHHVVPRLGKQGAQLVLGLRIGLGNVNVAPRARSAPAAGLRVRSVVAARRSFLLRESAQRSLMRSTGRRAGEDRHARACPHSVKEPGEMTAAPQRRAGLLHRPGPQCRDVHLVELAVVDEGCLAPDPLEDLDDFLHALAAVVAAQPAARRTHTRYRRGALADTDIDAAPC